MRVETVTEGVLGQRLPYPREGLIVEKRPSGVLVSPAYFTTSVLHLPWKLSVFNRNANSKL